MLFLEEPVRTGSGHVSEIGGNGAEGLVLFVGKDERELAVMQAVRVDLFMMETGGADERVRREARQGLWSQARVGGELAVLGQPLREGAGADAEAETLFDPLCRAPARLATVVEAEALQDHLEWGCASRAGPAA